MSEQYNVIFRGELTGERDLQAVQDDFAKIFKISQEKAEKYFSGKAFFLRKKVDQQLANEFKTTLEKAGALVELKRIEPEKPLNPNELSLVPTETELKEKAAAEKAAEEAMLKQVSKEDFACPKCETEQQQEQECVSCGIIFEKFFARQETLAVAGANGLNADINFNCEQDSAEKNITPAKKRQTDNLEADSVVTEDAEDSLNKNAMIAAFCAALLGAFLWKFIAVAFDYELGLIAWGIGGAVGFAAVSFGSKGQTAGIVCGLLTCLAIFGGKYMAYDTFRSQLNDVFSTPSEEMKNVYEGEKWMAELYFSEVKDEQSKKEFMAEYGYSEFQNANDVTQYELEEFEQYTLPRFEKLNSGDSSFERWLETGFQAQVGDYSTFDMMQENFGFIDLLFLFFGIGTAFRLGSNEAQSA